MKTKRKKKRTKSQGKVGKNTVAHSYYKELCLMLNNNNNWL